MQEQIADRPSIATLVALIPSPFLAGAFLAGALLLCGPAARQPGTTLMTVFADPGKYQVFSCEHLGGPAESIGPPASTNSGSSWTRPSKAPGEPWSMCSPTKPLTT